MEVFFVWYNECLWLQCHKTTVQFTEALKTNNATPGPAAKAVVAAVPRRAASSAAQMLLSLLMVAVLGGEGQGTESSMSERRW